MNYPSDGKCKNCGAVLPPITYGRCTCAFCETEYVQPADNRTEAPLENDPIKATLLCEKADRAYQNNRMGEALAYLDEALQYDSENYLIWTKMGRVYRLINNPDKAKECYRKALNIKPNAIEVIANLGALELTIHNYQLAYQYCKRAYEAAGATPGDGAIYTANYALAVAKIGNKKEALQILKIARKRGYKNYFTIKKMIKQS